jgi:arylsulfatase A-like enzyme
MFDGYDTGVRYADENLGRVLNLLEELDVGNQTAVLISADHGECLGELNVYGDHQTADEITHRVPMILRWPGLTDKFRGQAHRALHYQIDVAATVVELVGRQVPRNWDGSSFAGALREGVDAGRDSLVLSHGAWSCQRAARFEDYICVRSYHDGLHDFPEVMLFNLREDPHEQHDLASKRPDIVARAMNLLDGWYGTMMRSSQNGVDPMWTVLREGGPFHTRGELPNYLERLRKTGRSEAGARLAAAHPNEVDGQA